MADKDKPDSYVSAIDDLQWRERIDSQLQIIREMLPLHAAAIQNPDSLAIISAINQRIDDRLGKLNDDISQLLRTMRVVSTYLQKLTKETGMDNGNDD
jgi:hypothetical protein